LLALRGCLELSQVGHVAADRSWPSRKHNNQDLQHGASWSEARIRACRVRCPDAEIARKTAFAEKQNKAAQATAIEPFSGPFFAPRHALKFHKKQLLTGCHFGLYGIAFSCQTKPDLTYHFRN
jgi:hypothetical protein